MAGTKARPLKKARYMILCYLKDQESLTIAEADFAAAIVRRTAEKKTGEAKATDVAEAIKLNPKEVRIINSGLESHRPFLAGYLGLSDTKALREFTAETKVSENLIS